MIGIKSYSVYVPLWRLDLGCVREGWRGERAIANFDEDSLTMGVAAGINCLQHIERKEIDGLFFASSTFPYKEKQNAVTAATALDLREDILTADFANSLRAGTTALKAAVDAVKAGSAKQIMVIAADMRLPTPGSDFEREFGDGAAAFLVSGTGAKVAIEDSSSVIDEIFDIWRNDEDKFVRSWEERFNVEEGYFRVLPKAISALLEKKNLTAKDFSKAVFNGPNARRHQEMGRKLGFAAEQLQAPMFGSVGDTGAASSLMMLAVSLEKAKAGDKLLLANYGNGADAFLLEVVKEIDANSTLQEYVDSKMVLKDYKRYLHWRGLLEMTTGRRRPPTPSPSVTCLWRETAQNIRLYGVKCKICGMVQYPPQRVCYNCHTKDEFEDYRLSDKRAILFTYTEDYATPNPDPPLALAVVDFEGGGRMWAYMVDRGEKEVQLGMPVEMTFRKLFTTEGIHNYYWKCMPVRFSEEG
ncbi:OB-fold domain-containing protein [Chloroflexota bacterium]